MCDHEYSGICEGDKRRQKVFVFLLLCACVFGHLCEAGQTQMCGLRPAFLPDQLSFDFQFEGAAASD